MSKLCRVTAPLVAAMVWTAWAAPLRAQSIEGAIYDAESGATLAGVEVQLRFDTDDPLTPGALVPAANLVDGQQGQQTGDGGRYRFDVDGLADSRRLRLEVRVEPLSYGFPSQRVSPSDELAPSGVVVPGFNPGADGARLYYLRFAPVSPSFQVTNNHIPLDAIRSDVALSMSSSRARAEVGDVVTLRVSVENRSSRDLVGSRRAYLRLAPARGLDVVAGSAAARVDGGEAVALASGAVSSGERLVRLGLLELAAGSSAVIELRAVIGVDTRPGRTVSRAVIVDGAGVTLSSEAEVVVEIERGRGLESSMIIGRVFCDDDGDGAPGRGEAGVFGARVFLDTGSFAVTDSGGLFHFTRVAEGTRHVKVEQSPNRSRGNPGRLLRLTPGLPGKANFPMRCKHERVTGKSPRVALSHRSRPMRTSDPALDSAMGKRLLLEGDLLLLAVKLDGEELALPTASARIEAADTIKLAGDGGVNLQPVPPGGYSGDHPRFVLSFQPPAGVVASRWMFVIAEASESGRGAPFFSMSGAGEPPAAIEWDGRGSGGVVARRDQLYVAQLVVIGSRAKIEAASALVPFGIGFGQVSRGPSAMTWRGALFGADLDKPQASPALTTNVDSLVKSLGDGDTVDVEVHSGSIRSRMDALAITQQRADLIKALIVAGGVDAKVVIARGRGAAEPIATGPDAAKTNDRVEVRVARRSSANSGGAVPTTMATVASALVDGQPINVDDSGHFRWEGAIPERGAVLVDVQAKDGRRASVDVALGDDQGKPDRRIGEAVISADLDAPTVVVGDRTLDPRLLDLDVALSADGKTMTVSIPAELDTRRVVAVITSASGNDSRVALEPDQRALAMPTGLEGPLTVRVIAELADGSRAYSPRRSTTGKADELRGEVIVNGVTWPLVGQRARGTVPISEGGAVLVDVTRPSGQRAIYVVVIAAAEPGASSGEAVASSASKTSPVRRGVPVDRAELLASAAADFSIDLPEAGGSIDRRLPLRGRARPGNVITVNDQPIVVGADGVFTTIAWLAPGKTSIKITSEDTSGFRAELIWPVEVGRTSMFVMGLGELIVATAATERGLFSDSAFLAGMSPDTTWAAGPMLIAGRATLYLKGELAPRRVFDRVGFTVHLDTSKRRDGAAFFEDVLNPVRDEPVLGDSAIEVRDRNGSGKLYVRLEAEESGNRSTAVLGALVAELGRGRLFRYGRTIDGAGVNLVKELGSSRIELDAFGTAETAQSQRDQVAYRSTGGTLYYLRFADVVEGSELIRVIVRDRDSGMSASEKVLRRNVDYTIDYISGRVWLINPAPSSVASAFLLSNSDASLSPDAGNPVYIEARYEHRGAAAGERAAGLEARYALAGLEISAGAAGEWRDGSDDYRLWGARASYSLGERSRVSAEISESKRREGAARLSIDGGLSFRDLAWSDEIENPEREPGQAWHLGATLEGGDFKKSLEGTRVELYAQDIDREFSATATELERGRLKYGGRVLAPLGGDDELLVRHQADVSEVPRIGPTAGDVGADVFATDERATELTSAAWIGRRDRLTLGLEVAHHRLTSDAVRADGSPSLDARRLGVGGRSSFAFNEQLSLSIFQEVWTGLRDADPTLAPIDPMAPTTRTDEPLAGITSGVGVAWKLLPDATLTGELRQRWNGDQAAGIGLRASLSELGSFYIAERAERGIDGPRAVTVIGADDRFGPGGTGRSYGEYQIENTSSGARNRAVLGLGQRWRMTPEVGVGLGFEHQQIFGGFLPDGTPVGNNQRDLIRASLDVAVARRIRLGVIAEVRADRGADGDDVDRELIDADPRDPSGGGFADHGGVAPGAPLILRGGDQTQLVGSAGLTWRPQEGVSLFARGRGARTLEGPSIGFSEVTGGLAYRSLLDDRLALLLRYTFLRERRPEATSLESEEAHILAVVPVADLSRRWRLSGKVAFKRSVAEGGVAADASTNAVLSLARLGYRVMGNWDATIEGRGLLLSADQRQMLLGSLVELGYYFDEFFRLGIGYNFSHFNDQELGDLTRDAHGFFVRLTAEI